MSPAEIKSLLLNVDVPYWNCVLKKNYVCPDPSIRFYLYTPESTYRTRLDMRDHGSLHRAGFRRDRKNVIVVHGFNGTESKTPMTFLRDAYLSRGYQVVTVDWEPLTRFPCYLSALSNTKLVGQCAAQMYSYLMVGGGRAKATTCVGHSLGAHICGMISNHLTRKQHKIIGLDPAKPLVDRFGSRKFRLTREDAHIVQVIHTNAGFLGEEAQVGHLDFCVNGGRIQPYCKGHPIRRSRCSHFLSACYLAQAVRSRTPLRGVPCNRGCPRSGVGHWISAILPAPAAPPPLPEGHSHEMFSIGEESTDK
ncbi:phospholipase A1-like [Ctenocephalides felis]|uniref:phospholipase A1-like n=1 Tax=Ctenocephalides felis TaxID=7515 RepID=UPI000E6E1128|nr:phospholipase A1-like [Ctenocephalides felis]